MLTMTQIDVYQGNQIGGCVTVITATKGEETRRIMIDYGSSLPESETVRDFEYPWEELPIDAVFFTHCHGDHVGRMMEIPDNIPLYMGETARKVMLNIQEQLQYIDGPERDIHKKEYELLKDDNRIHTFKYNSNSHCFDTVTDIPLFRIEPYSVDHSAYDAYMFLIEAVDETKDSGKKVIVHTGDFRGHGRRGKAMLKIIDYYIHQNRNKNRVGNHREVDVLITEGTMMSRLSEKVKTEQEMQMEAAKYLRKHKHAFLICSSTNLDSLASFYQAWQSACSPHKGYMYTYNRYFEKQLKTFSDSAGGFSNVYQFENVYHLDLERELHHAKWSQLKTQKELMEEKGFLAVIKPNSSCEKYIEAFMDCEDKPVIIYSMWDGYLNPEHKAYKKEWDDFLKAQEVKGIEIKYLHTSGHATSKMIEDVIAAIDPKEEIIPMHTECPEEFLKLDIREELKERITITSGKKKDYGDRRFEDTFPER